MAVIKGQDVYLRLASSTVNGITNTSFESSTNMIDVTTQDSLLDAEYLAGVRTKNFTFEGKDDPADTYAYDELYAAQTAGTSVAFIIGNGVKTTGGRVIYGNCLISSLSLNNPYDSNAGFTCNCQVTGSATIATSSTTVA